MGYSIRTLDLLARIKQHGAIAAHLAMLVVLAVQTCHPPLLHAIPHSHSHPVAALLPIAGGSHHEHSGHSHGPSDGEHSHSHAIHQASSHSEASGLEGSTGHSHHDSNEGDHGHDELCLLCQLISKPLAALAAPIALSGPPLQVAVAPSAQWQAQATFRALPSVRGPPACDAIAG